MSRFKKGDMVIVSYDSFPDWLGWCRPRNNENNHDGEIGVIKECNYDSYIVSFSSGEATRYDEKCLLPLNFDKEDFKSAFKIISL